jgi:hypothetical protein
VRTLKFENNELGQKRFEVLFHGLFVIGNQSSQKGLTVLRTEISLLDKFESISKPCECGKKLFGSKEQDREIDFNSNGHDNFREFTISDNEFDLLYDYVSKVPWSIGDSSRLALKTLDWLKNGS